MTPIAPRRFLLASSSAIRLSLLQNAGLDVVPQAPRVDEETIRQALESEGAQPRDIADTLAEMKARKIAERHLDALVLGCDQVLEFDRRVWGKPETLDNARVQLQQMRGKPHRLLSALVLYDRGEPVWRHVSRADLTMRSFSDIWLEDYLSRNWDSIRHSVGCYKLEEEGVRLFSRIEGDYFTILGLPLLPLLSYLEARGFIAS
ncbi:MAG: septum formation protein Maf [Rhodobacteraceae bacterium GWE1_64_9]|nr:MAG: septum formation protein Maf [Rhodobacteraceae bacterium GWE1_64_9]OHC47792.1 MAG: septum formation protein Maf [Rhodobacteraceae bacterium GWF1_65_7]HBU13816.1 septum formation protein Maf [Gemmobacter sp.]